MADPTVESLLSQLLSTDNNIRSRAEVTFNDAKTEADPLTLGMVSCLRFSHTVGLRSIAAVLLRQILTKDEESIYPKLSDEGKKLLKNQLIIALQSEPEQHIVQKVLHYLYIFALYIIYYIFMHKCIHVETKFHSY